MKSIHQYLLEIIRLALPLVILGAGFWGYHALANQRKAPQSQKVEVSAPLVETLPVMPCAEGLELSLDGMVVPFREIQISAEVAGRITRKFSECQAGRYIKAGTPLLNIDNRNYLLSVTRAKEEVAQAEDKIEELKVEFNNFDSSIEILQDHLALEQKELQRAKQAFAGGGFNESELTSFFVEELNARNALVSMQNNKRKAVASEKRLINARDLAETKLKEAELDLEKVTIYAPIDGVIVSENVEEGNYVSSGTMLITIEDTSAAEVRSTLRMQEINWIWQQDHSPGDIDSLRTASRDYQLPQVPATITYRLGEQTYQWQGRLSRFEGIGLNEQTRTVPVRILIPDPRNVTTKDNQSGLYNAGPKALVRGMFVKIKLHARPSIALLKIPERAVQPGKTVWVVRDNRLKEISLNQINYQNGHIVVTAAATELRMNDQIVVTALPLAINGMEVKVLTTQITNRDTEQLQGHQQ